ncbi:peroxiredoxin [Rubrivivax gelatinosus]|uniref:peroxiredoxin n=1 Tax=Rubrivivax gelatinosus TaxID=28068 RepID=UPI0005C2411B|nr:peroxiredoxin [Rubrivivax gelatinosus]
MTPVVHKTLPDFEAPATGGVKFSPAAYRGHAVVLYFYPKDATPGCTTEAMQFRDHRKKVKGIERSTFLIDADGVMRAEWRGIKVAGHVEEILQAVQALKQKS